ncbi:MULTISPECIES: ABC transporter permease subunit [unclassified Haladaptatus]|uniref:ABC transporter permease subunit n=1 Tax=unclassified Haladaptatus TaxID=2622732 RepID=UPI0023E85204|nr:MULTISPECIES: ABC transporter permease subunit [unclassified Haladaptatus]
MTAVTVAKKDFADAIRSKVLIALATVFVLFAVGAAYVFAEYIAPTAGNRALSTVGLIVFLLGPVGTLVPLTGLLVGYKAIVGERESGSLKFLLALPHTRRDVVLGKLLGRSGVLATAILAGFVLAAVVVVVLYSSFSASAFVGFTLLTLLFGVVFVSVGVGISGATGSASKATALVFAFFVLFEFVWGFIPSLLLYAIEGVFFTPNPPDWYLFIANISPSSAYSNAIGLVLPANAGIQSAGNVPSVFMEPWFGLLVLLVWAAVPLAIGYYRFENADL